MRRGRQVGVEGHGTVTERSFQKQSTSCSLISHLGALDL